MACSRVRRGGDLVPGTSAAGSISEAVGDIGVLGLNWLLCEGWSSDSCSADGDAGLSLILLLKGSGISPDKEAAREILLRLCTTIRDMTERAKSCICNKLKRLIMILNDGSSTVSQILLKRIEV